MYKSYYFLNRYIIELRQKLINHKVKEIFSQEKDKLIFHLYGDKEIYLEISVNPGDPFINVKDKFNRARKNTVNFFSQLIGSVIKNVLIASDDRIVLISTNQGEIYFAIRGQFTNIFFISDKIIEPFKKEEAEQLNKFLEEFSEKKYLCSFNSIKEEELRGKTLEEIRKEFPFTGKDIVNEVKLRLDNNEETDKSLYEVLNVIEHEKPVLYTDLTSGNIQIGFDKLKIFAGMEKEYFNDLITAFNSYLSKKYYVNSQLSKQKIIQSFLDKELKKVINKLNNLQSVIIKGSNETDLNKFANLLLININEIKVGADSIELNDIYEKKNKITIPLDPRLSPNQNVKKYFDKARDSRINYEKAIKLKSEAQKYFDKLKLVEKKLLNAQSLNDLETIMDELKLKTEKTEKTKDDFTSKFKHYIIEKKYNVYVGKDSANNDLLTTKFAKQNDFWFHARSVSGSHVVLRVENVKEAVPKSILKKTASLAAYHSKAKTAGVVPVSYTLKKYVIKRKGMPIGQVSLTKEDVLLVKPEIPSGCEYQSTDQIN